MFFYAHCGAYVTAHGKLSSRHRKGRPITFPEIMALTQRRFPVTARNPEFVAELYHLHQPESDLNREYARKRESGRDVDSFTNIR